MVTVGHLLRAGRRRLRSTALVAIALICGGAQPRSSTAQVASEYEVKAAFLYNFAKFVEWPTEAFPHVDDPFGLCILGDDPFGGLLERAVSGKTVQERTFAIRHITDSEDAVLCNLLFVSSSEGGRLRHVLSLLKRVPVLVVGDTEDIVYDGGMIGFHMEGNRVRFMVNQDAVERAGLQISSQLLKVADRVIAAQGPP
jgi:hypothetical protein